MATSLPSSFARPPAVPSSPSTSVRLPPTTDPEPSPRDTRAPAPSTSRRLTTSSPTLLPVLDGSRSGRTATTSRRAPGVPTASEPTTVCFRLTCLPACPRATTWSAPRSSPCTMLPLVIPSSTRAVPRSSLRTAPAFLFRSLRSTKLASLVTSTRTPPASPSTSTRSLSASTPSPAPMSGFPPLRRLAPSRPRSTVSSLVTASSRMATGAPSPWPSTLAKRSAGLLPRSAGARAMFAGRLPLLLAVPTARSGATTARK